MSYINAAAVYGVGLTGILLSGASEDGDEGLKAIKQKGGYTIFQDPADALVNDMPEQARMKSKIDERMDLEGITRYRISLMLSWR